MTARRVLGALRAGGSACSRLHAEERGMTVVEGVVAAMLLILGALGVMQVFDTTTRNNFRSEQSQVINNRLQAELEWIKRLPYAEVALTEYPASADDGDDPRFRVAGTQFAVDRSGDASSEQELVVEGSAIPGTESTVANGEVPPGPDPFSTGDISGQIYRFVTWTSDPACPECGDAVMKRVIVAAKVDSAPVSFDRTFQEVQTEIPDPEVRPDPNPAPPGEEQPGNTAELWLTDTTCDNLSRLPPDVPHDAHNTRGLCADADGDPGGEARGAPDLLFPEAPPAVDPESTPSLGDHDFSAELGGSADGVGLSMPWVASGDCLLEPVLDLANTLAVLEGELAPVVGDPEPHDGLLDLSEGAPGQHLVIHEWLSPEVSGDGAVLTGEGTLDLWTRTVEEASYAGDLCLSLFVRHVVQMPVLPDEVEVCTPESECQTVAVELEHVDLTTEPEPTLCVEIDGDQACGEAPLSSVEVEVDVPLLNVGALTNTNGLVCQQGLDLPYFQCGMIAWPAEWSKLSIPIAFEAVGSSGQPVPAALPPGSRVGLALMAKEGDGSGFDFMYDHVDFESRLQLRTEELVSFQGA